MNHHFVTNDLGVVLSDLVVDWANEADFARHGNPDAEAHERAFWFGLNCGFMDSIDEVLELLRNPTIEGAIVLTHILNQRRERVQGRVFENDVLNLEAQSIGAGEAYRQCAETLMLALVKTLRRAESPLDYPC